MNRIPTRQVPSCEEICDDAFRFCTLSVPQTAEVGRNVFRDTALIKASAFELDRLGQYKAEIDMEVNEWIQSINQDNDAFALHRECASCNPSKENIYKIIKREGLPSLNVPNEINITPNMYLAEDPYNEIDQQKIINKLVLELLGEEVITGE